MSIISEDFNQDSSSFYICHIYDSELKTYSYYLEYHRSILLIDPLIGQVETYEDLAKQRKSHIRYVAITHLSSKAVMAYQDFYERHQADLIISDQHKYNQQHLPNEKHIIYVKSSPKNKYYIFLGQNYPVYFKQVPGVTSCSIIGYTDEFIFSGASFSQSRLGILCPYFYAPKHKLDSNEKDLLKQQFKKTIDQFLDNLQVIFQSHDPDLVILPSVKIGKQKVYTLGKLAKKYGFPYLSSDSDIEEKEELALELMIDFMKVYEKQQKVYESGTIDYRSEIMQNNININIKYSELLQNFNEANQENIIQKLKIQDEMEKQNEPIPQLYKVIDTRDKEDYLKNHIQKSVNINPDLQFTQVLTELFTSDLYCFIFDGTQEKCKQTFLKLINTGYLNIEGYHATEGKTYEKMSFDEASMHKDIEIVWAELDFKAYFSQSLSNREITVYSQRKKASLETISPPQYQFIPKLVRIKPALEFDKYYKITFQINKINEKRPQLFGIGIAEENQSDYFYPNQNKDSYFISAVGQIFKKGQYEQYEAYDFQYKEGHQVKVEFHYQRFVTKLLYTNLTTNQYYEFEVIPDSTKLCNFACFFASQYDEIQLLEAVQINHNLRNKVSGKSHKVNKFTIGHYFKDIIQKGRKNIPIKQFPQLMKLIEQPIPNQDFMFYFTFNKIKEVIKEQEKTVQDQDDLIGQSQNKSIQEKCIGVGIASQSYIEDELKNLQKRWQAKRDDKAQLVFCDNLSNNQQRNFDVQKTFSFDSVLLHKDLNLKKVDDYLNIVQFIGKQHTDDEIIRLKTYTCGECNKSLKYVEENPYQHYPEKGQGYKCKICNKYSEENKFYHCSCVQLKIRSTNGNTVRDQSYDICTDCYKKGNQDAYQKLDYCCIYCQQDLYEGRNNKLDPNWSCQICSEFIEIGKIQTSMQCNCTKEEYHICHQCYEEGDRRAFCYIKPDMPYIQNQKYVMKYKISKLQDNSNMGIGICNEDCQKQKVLNMEDVIKSYNYMGIVLIQQDGLIIKQEFEGDNVVIKTENSRFQMFYGDIITVELNSEQTHLTYYNSRQAGKTVVEIPKGRIFAGNDSKKKIFNCMFLNKTNDSVIIEDIKTQQNPFSAEEGDTVLGMIQHKQRQVIFKNLRTQEFLVYDKYIGEPMYPVVIASSENNNIEYSSSRQKICLLKANEIVSGQMIHGLDTSREYECQFLAQKIGLHSQIGIGICLSNYMEIQSFQFNENDKNHGVYMIQSDGKIFSHHEASINGKIAYHQDKLLDNNHKPIFSYQMGDTIIMKLLFAENQIKFINLSNEQELILDIQYDSSVKTVYPCCLIMCHDDQVFFDHCKEIRDNSLKQFELSNNESINAQKLKNMINEQHVKSIVQSKRNNLLKPQPFDFLEQSQLFQSNLEQSININKKMILLDVRFEKEYKYGKILGAIRLPVNKMDKENCISILGQPENQAKDIPIILFSKYGYISVLALGILENYGYQNLMNLEDGFFALEALDFKKIDQQNYSFLLKGNNSNYNEKGDIIDNLEEIDSEDERKKEQKSLEISKVTDIKEELAVIAIKKEKDESRNNYREMLNDNEYHANVAKKLKEKYQKEKMLKQQQQNEQQNNDSFNIQNDSHLNYMNNSKNLAKSYYNDSSKYSRQNSSNKHVKFDDNQQEYNNSGKFSNKNDNNNIYDNINENESIKYVEQSQYKDDFNNNSQNLKKSQQNSDFKNQQSEVQQLSKQNSLQISKKSEISKQNSDSNDKNVEQKNENYKSIKEINLDSQKNNNQKIDNFNPFGSEVVHNSENLDKISELKQKDYNQNNQENQQDMFIKTKSILK